MTTEKILPQFDEVEITLPGTDIAIKNRRCYKCGDTITPGMECLIYQYNNRYGSGNHSVCPICGLEMLKEAQRDIQQGLEHLKKLQPLLRKYCQDNKILANKVLQRL